MKVTVTWEVTKFYTSEIEVDDPTYVLPEIRHMDTHDETSTMGRTWENYSIEEVLLEDGRSISQNEPPPADNMSGSWVVFRGPPTTTYRMP